MSKTRTILALALAGAALAGFGLCGLVLAAGWGVVFVIAGGVCFAVAERLRIEQHRTRRETGEGAVR